MAVSYSGTIKSVELEKESYAAGELVRCKATYTATIRKTGELIPMAWYWNVDVRVLTAPTEEGGTLLDSDVTPHYAFGYFQSYTHTPRWFNVGIMPSGTLQFSVELWRVD